VNASEKFSFFMDGSLTQSKGGFDSWGVLGTTIPAEHDTNHDLDYTATNTYSDLDFTMFEFTYGMTFLVDNKTKLYTAVTTMDLTDDQPYVYGDQDGDITVYSAGMTVGF
jgi:hypothetical protein